MPDDKFTICGKWPPGLRPLRRLAITKLPSNSLAATNVYERFRQYVGGKLRKPRGKRRIWPFGG